MGILIAAVQGGVQMQPEAPSERTKLTEGRGCGKNDKDAILKGSE